MKRYKKSMKKPVISTPPLILVAPVLHAALAEDPTPPDETHARAPPVAQWSLRILDIGESSQGGAAFSPLNR